MRPPWEGRAWRSLIEVARFDPGTAMLVAASVAGVSQVAGGIQQYQQGQQNQAIANQQATATMAAATEQAQEQGTQTARMQGELRANAAASGVDADQGTPVAAAVDLGQQGSLQQQLTLYRGTTQAQSQRYGGALQAYQGNAALGQGIVGGASSFLQGYALNKYLTPSPSLDTQLQGYGMLPGPSNPFSVSAS